MRTIIRCPSCFTYVYDDAKACHGCGERVGKRKILRRGSWVLIALIVCAYAAGRGINLHDERQSRIRSAFETAARSHAVTGFLRAWLAGDDVGVASSLATSSGVCKGEILKLRALYPTVLPATDVIRIELVKSWEERHRRDKGKITHMRAGLSESDPKARLSASCKPKRSTGGGAFWTIPSFDFEAEFQKDGESYTAFGRVCIDYAHKVCCLTIDHIQGVEGVVEAEE
jgi:hypothetical protein